MRAHHASVDVGFHLCSVLLLDVHAPVHLRHLSGHCLHLGAASTHGGGAGVVDAVGGAVAGAWQKLETGACYYLDICCCLQKVKVVLQ